MGWSVGADMRPSGLLRGFIAALATAAVTNAASAAPACPPAKDGLVVFSDRSIAMSTGLAVNPDGAAASYTPGDHGYTYISNGANLIDHGLKVACSAAANAARCRRDWAAAEGGGFGPGTPEFCVFAMEVEPLVPGARKIPCEQKGRYVVGNGKGRPAAGAPVATVDGGTLVPYASTTTLTHTRNGKTVYVDSTAVPGLVAPRRRPDLVGAVAWVRFGGRALFAVVNDTGPNFGEGSIALHQELRSGQVGPFQPLGPLGVAQRCGPAETGLKPPFVSRPDGGQADRCRAGYRAKTSADIRAYTGIEKGVTSIILPLVRPPMTGLTVKVEITPALLQDLALKAGYTPEKLAGMAACVAH